MASSIYLTVYSFSVQCSRNNHNCWQMFQTYFQQRRHEAYRDANAQQLLEISHFDQLGRSISGFLRKGEYGIASELIDVKQNRITHRRSPIEAEMLPFYFLVAVLVRECHGLIILQRTGIFGVKRILERDLATWWRQHGCDLDINPLVPSELVNQLLEQGRVVKIRLIRYSIPSDIADVVYHGRHTPQDGYMELQIRAKRRKRFWIADKARSILNGQGRISDFMEIKGFEYENIKLEIELGGGRRTIDFAHLERVRPRYDITQDIDMDGGMPVFESVDQIARIMAVDILKGIGIEEEEVSQTLGS